MAFLSSQESSAFGTLLRRFRHAAGLSQEELATLAGLSTHAVGDLERGYRSRPHQETVMLLLQALNLNEQDRAVFEVAARRLPRTQDATRPFSGGVAAHTAGGLDFPPLVGRARELAFCKQQLAAEKRGILLISGEPGIGKTRLLYEVGRYALVQGWCVLSATCQRTQTRKLYAPILDIIMLTLSQQTPAERRTNLRECAWLTLALPELTEELPVPTNLCSLSPEREKRLVTSAIVQFFSNLSSPVGTLLLLDDLYLADNNTLELVSYLLDTLPNKIMLQIIATYQDKDIAVAAHTGFLHQLTYLIRMQMVCHLTLEPLIPDESTVLLRYLLPEVRESDQQWLYDWLLQRTGGVPFFLIHCALHLRLTHDIAYDQPAVVARQSKLLEVKKDGRNQRHNFTVPWVVAQSIRQRIALLPPPGLAAVQVVAAAEQQLSADLLMRVLMLFGYEEHLAVDGIEAAKHARLLVEEESYLYDFAHSVIREVADEDLGAARRMMLRRQLTVAEEADEVEQTTPLVQALLLPRAQPRHFCKSRMTSDGYFSHQ